MRKPRDAAAVLFGLKFADNIHYKFESSQASKARIQSSKHTGAKQNLTQNDHSRSFKVTCFGVSGKAVRGSVVLNANSSKMVKADFKFDGHVYRDCPGMIP